MWPIISIIVICVGIVAVEVPSLRKQKRKKELWIFWALLVFGAGLTVADALQVKIPNPLDWISIVYKPLSDLIYKPLK
ncbi:hypothetical protein [Paenibacillus sp. MBLB4367]|uniref:hypothetical protein n=1 Tax=Paenibacillus sp. MBLB4367 TaxID=3384767 RepID=UPI00390802F3